MTNQEALCNLPGFVMLQRGERERERERHVALTKNDYTKLA
jgi:hypothetical protein